MRAFEYYEPNSIDDLLRKTSELGSRARMLAGGTDLLVKMKQKLLSPECVVNLKTVPGLRGITYEGGVLKILTLTTIAELEKSGLVRENFEVLAKTAAVMASPQIRNLATVGGNLCNAAPSADMAPPLIALDSKVAIVSGSGERLVPLEEFFTGPGTTVLRPGEILREIRVPRQPEASAAVYLKHGVRRAMDIAVVGVAARVDKSPDGGVSLVRIVQGAVAPIPLRTRDAEDVILSGGLTLSAIEKAADIASGEVKPITDVRGSEWYRREMVRVLTRRALLECAVTLGLKI